MPATPRYRVLRLGATLCLTLCAVACYDPDVSSESPSSMAGKVDDPDADDGSSESLDACESFCKNELSCFDDFDSEADCSSQCDEVGADPPECAPQWDEHNECLAALDCNDLDAYWNALAQLANMESPGTFPCSATLGDYSLCWGEHDGGTDDGAAPGGCGWGTFGEADEFEGYVCGGEGSDPSGEAPIDCPVGIQAGDPCGTVDATGCCDANGDLFFCIPVGDEPEIVKEDC